MGATSAVVYGGHEPYHHSARHTARMVTGSYHVGGHTYVTTLHV